MVKIALIQFSGRQDKGANITRATAMIEQAARQGAQIVCPHELVSTIFFPFEENDRYFAWAEPIPGPSVDHFAALAREHRSVIIVPIFETVAGSEYYNSAAVVGPDGTLLGTYRKNSIPHVRRDVRKPSGYEKYYFRPGDRGFPVFETPFGVKLGILICFDRHFPEHFRALALNGAQLICVPTTSPRTGQRAWLFELQAAAYNNGCWIAGVNRVGYDEGGSDGDWFGRSVLINPLGDVVLEGSDRDEEVLVADFDPAMTTQVRAATGYIRDRRPELYSRLIG
jgi:N-carbamoylputrescine amidase